MSYPEAKDVQLGGVGGDNKIRTALASKLLAKVNKYKWSDQEAMANLRVRVQTIHHLRHNRINRLTVPVLESMDNMMNVVEKRKLIA